MKLGIKIATFLTPLVVSLVLAVEDAGELKGTCRDATWAPFGDSKCYKLIQQFSTWDEASQNCEAISNHSGETSLATIKSADEEAFVTNYLFSDATVENNVWIGAHLTNGVNYTWVDGETVEYTNWLAGSPSWKECVQIESGFGRAENIGKWKDVGCNQGHWALCEGIQIWNYNEVVAAIVQLRNELEKIRQKDVTHENELGALNVLVGDQDTQIENLDGELEIEREKIVGLEKELAKQNNNPVPIGFVYVQLPRQPEPAVIWPNVGWTDVTGNYAGLFFRAEGGNSASFGSDQNDQTRRITQTEYRDSEYDTGSYSNPNTLPETGWSDTGLAGGNYAYGTHYYEGLRFLTNDVEVRPKNTAVRIWTRSS